MSCFEYKILEEGNSQKELKIINLYKHNDFGKEECLNELKNFIIQTNNHQANNNGHSPILVIGDFNIDFNKETNRMEKMKSDLHLEPLLDNVISFRRNKETCSQLDWAFCNGDFSSFASVENIQIYETWYSDHNAILIELKID